MYMDASVRNGRAGIGIYAKPSRVRISKTVASSDQADAHLTELLAISEAANWLWGPFCVAHDSEGRPVPASSIRMSSAVQSALQSVQSWRASACQEAVAEIVRKLRMVNVTLHWIPGHAGVEGNEQADGLARAATRVEGEAETAAWTAIRRAIVRARRLLGRT